MGYFFEAHELPSSCDMWTYLPCGVWDLSSLTGDWTHVPCTEGSS